MALSDVAVIVAAGGRGKRMGAPFNKQYLELKGRPLLAYTLEVFLRLKPGQMVVVVGPGEKELFEQKVLPCLKGKSDLKIVSGGALRQDSVYNGLKALKSGSEYVCIHDGARPFVTPALVHSVLKGSREVGGAAACVPLKDTIKEVDASGYSITTPPREKYRAVQTPQVFRRDIIIDAYARAREEGFLSTDETSLVERYGYRVLMVPGTFSNIKVTTPEDLFFAEAILRERGRDNACGDRL